MTDKELLANLMENDDSSSDEPTTDDVKTADKTQVDAMASGDDYGFEGNELLMSQSQFAEDV